MMLKDQKGRSVVCETVEVLGTKISGVNCMIHTEEGIELENEVVLGEYNSVMRCLEIISDMQTSIGVYKMPNE